MGEKMILLPCPFCGSEARCGQYDIPAVKCSNEECGAQLHSYHREDAYKLWNTRATLARTVDIEAVREVIATLRHPDTVSIRIDHMADKLAQAIGDKT